jgi:hypothetical protein
MTEVRIEYPSEGATYSRQAFGVYRYDTYERGSVLEGQERRTFLGQYTTLEQAQADHPEATAVTGCGYRETVLPINPPAWFDPANAGELWSEDEY